MKEGVQVPRIKPMSAILANQIAAGEVVERPASVVKELLENALDAGASKLLVEVERAGTALIRVSDNGHGIHPDDMALALQRHATAKVHEQADLLAINSLGFRGEALPSISSVSSMEITSRIAAEAEARRVYSKPDGLVDVQPAAHPIGTTVEVRGLFHNIPARKKYLRSERTEFLHIQETVRRIALSRFDFRLELRHNNRAVFNCRGGLEDAARRIAPVFGNNFTDSAVKLDQAADGMRLWGWLGLEQLSRSSSDRQYLYLNGRVIYDRRLNHAIRVASEELIAAGRYPVYLFYLELDKDAADVNVHPAKHEVRFRRARDVHDFVYAVIRDALKYRETDLFKAGEEAGQATVPMVNDSAVSSPWSGPVSDRANARPQTSASRDIKTTRNYGSAWGEILGQINQDYLLTRRNEELVLLNLGEIRRHIASQQLGDTEVRPKARPLLVPINLPISRDAENRFERLAKILSTYAFEIELNGPDSCRVRAIPRLLEQADIARLITALFEVEPGDRQVDDISRDLQAIMLEHIDDIPEAEHQHEALLGQLENYVEDSSRKKQAPLWFSLDKDDLWTIMQDGD